MNKIITKYYKSPAGEMLLGSYGGELVFCDWQKRKARPSFEKRILNFLKCECIEGESKAIKAAIKQFDEYFAGKRKSFALPLLFIGTEFQKKVWSELQKIPYGDTISYKQLAERTGNIKAVRAVANSNRVNAFSIIVPCHRVIGSNGKLTGYAGGLDIKQFLLDLEKNI